jgi:hypothetical protein
MDVNRPRDQRDELDENNEIDDDDGRDEDDLIVSIWAAIGSSPETFDGWWESIYGIDSLVDDRIHILNYSLFEGLASKIVPIIWGEYAFGNTIGNGWRWIKPYNFDDGLYYVVEYCYDEGWWLRAAVRTVGLAPLIPKFQLSWLQVGF